MVVWRKFALTALGIACPEVILEMAAGQWVRARQCVRDFNSEDFEQSQTHMQEHRHVKATGEIRTKEVWTMEMAFFADMGGFRLRTRNCEPFPIDARQLLYLVRKGYVQQPVFKPRMIEDKNKVDVLLRAIILCQTSWFLVTVIGRWAQHLVVTTAELTTVSFIFCSTVTEIFWWHKPADVVMAEIIEIDVEISEILTSAGQDPNAWRMTPLDFASREEWWWSKTWWNFLNILRKMHCSFGSEGRPIDRIADSCQRVLPRREQYLLLAITTGCFAIFSVAWHDDFPTETERMVWRGCCITMVSLLGIGLVISEVLQAYNLFQKGIQQASPRLPTSQSDTLTYGNWPNSKLKGIRKFIRRLDKSFDSIRNNSPDNDPQLYVPLRVILPLYVIGAIYWCCRTFILIEDAIGLRSLPTSAYASVSWEKFWPHLG
ncbi:MAG: hypothetical protein LQ350_006966 [Teloschistes chrysophthalmus]|nr:MAG: hypothetical protein LQ350_006966 [Niorma chrysophthalma]